MHLKRKDRAIDRLSHQTSFVAVGGTNPYDGHSVRGAPAILRWTPSSLCHEATHETVLDGLAQGQVRLGLGFETVFVTYSNDLQGQFRVPEATRMLWRSVDISRCEYSFLIEGMGIEDGCIGPIAHLVKDVPTVQMMQTAELGNFLSVSKIHLITPSEKNGGGSYAMELLSEIRVQAGTESRPVYEFITQGGQVYSTARPTRSSVCA